MTRMQIDRRLILGRRRVHVPHLLLDHAEPVMRVGLTHGIGGGEREETPQRSFATRQMLPRQG